MGRRPAAITQAEITRIVRAAKRAGAAEVVVKRGDEVSVVVRLTAPSTDEETPLAPVGEIVL